ncbi:TetR/AcrR family transcriptional regulator [Umezawaea sp. Da 62-37]|uniref:TetR/AcrR family transcriptional regulator n=1 Tax=Umezawaea sp. Da 62-37 TaxID=3075927 RepID=UPI0028F7479C|nr:TetR/AcrR family transcriptional regulator [Umezawaea sp. Da 62-37]WNV86919.1 TetR/AcrR family transcriptional regulator [Umezawaea sp. Da 62-37]
MSSAPVVGRTGVVKPERRESLREEQKRLTRGRLLDAAVSVFAEKSVINATMDDIAKAAGVARVTVYAHFPGKGDVVRALSERVYEVLERNYTGLAALPRWNRPAVRDWLDGVAVLWREIAPILRVVRVAGFADSAAGRSSVEARIHYVEEHERFASLLTADVGRWHGEPPQQAHQRALLALVHVESTLTAWIAAELPLGPAGPLDLLADSLCHLLGPAVRD